MSDFGEDLKMENDKASNCIRIYVYYLGGWSKAMKEPSGRILPGHGQMDMMFSPASQWGYLCGGVS